MAEQRRKRAAEKPYKAVTVAADRYIVIEGRSGPGIYWLHCSITALAVTDDQLTEILLQHQDLEIFDAEIARKSSDAQTVEADPMGCDVWIVDADATKIFGTFESMEAERLKLCDVRKRPAPTFGIAMQDFDHIAELVRAVRGNLGDPSAMRTNPRRR